MKPKWNQDATKMKPKRNQNETKMKRNMKTHMKTKCNMKPKWNQDEIELKLTWNQHETKLKPTWNHIETNMKPKRTHHETKMKSFFLFVVLFLCYLLFVFIFCLLLFLFLRFSFHCGSLLCFCCFSSLPSFPSPFSLCLPSFQHWFQLWFMSPLPQPPYHPKGGLIRSEANSELMN